MALRRMPQNGFEDKPTLGNGDIKQANKNVELSAVTS